MTFYKGRLTRRKLRKRTETYSTNTQSTYVVICVGSGPKICEPESLRWLAAGLVNLVCPDCSRWFIAAVLLHVKVSRRFIPGVCYMPPKLHRVLPKLCLQVYCLVCFFLEYPVLSFSWLSLLSTVFFLTPI